jgi:hypothetical protein
MPDSTGTRQPKDGKTEEEIQKVNAPRKPDKVSFWEVEEELVPHISIQSQGQERAVVEQPKTAACKPTEQKVPYPIRT